MQEKNIIQIKMKLIHGFNRTSISTQFWAEIHKDEMHILSNLVQFIYLVTIIHSIIHYTTECMVRWELASILIGWNSYNISIMLHEA